MPGIPSTSKKRQSEDTAGRPIEGSGKKKQRGESVTAVGSERADRMALKEQKKREREAKEQRKAERARKREARAKKAADGQARANVLHTQTSPLLDGSALSQLERTSESPRPQSAKKAKKNTSEGPIEEHADALRDHGKQKKSAEQSAVETVDGGDRRSENNAETTATSPKKRHRSTDVPQPSIKATGQGNMRSVDAPESPVVSPKKKRGRPKKVAEHHTATSVVEERLNGTSTVESPAPALEAEPVRNKTGSPSKTAGQEGTNAMEDNVRSAGAIDAPASIPKKRGRPRKVVDTHEAAKTADEVSGTSMAAKRKQGRPRKTVTDATQPTTQKARNSKTSLSSGVASGSNVGRARAKGSGRLSAATTGEEMQSPSTRTPRSEAQEKALLLAKFIGVEDEAILTDYLLDWKELRWLAEDRALQYRTGPFTSWEDDQISTVLEAFRMEHGWTADRFSDFLFGRREVNEQPLFVEMWRKATAAVPGRPNRSVRSRVRRIRTPNSQKGPWTQDEEDMLAIAVDKYGSNWTRIASQVGRSAEDCRLRWRDQQQRPDQLADSWSAHDREALRNAVQRHTPAPTSDRPSPATDWAKVCADLGNRRTRIQCVGRWRQEKANDKREEEGLPAWNAGLHAAEFVRRIRKQKEALDKDDLKEVDMDKLTQGWHRWPARNLRMHWRELYDVYVRPVSQDPEAKRSVEDYDRDLKANLAVIEDGLKHVVQGTPKPSKSTKKGVDMISSDEES